MDELTSWLLDARDGDREAFAAVVRTLQADVMRLTVHLVGHDDADDIVQDTFVRAWRSLPSYRAEAGARTWIVAIARRACADAIRSRQRRRRLVNRLCAQPAATQFVAGDAATQHALESLVMQLDEDRREAFVLTQVLGFSYEDTARICGVAVGTVKSRVARARTTLELLNEQAG